MEQPQATPGAESLPSPKLLIQIVQQPNGSVDVISPLSGPAVVEILIRLLPGTWEAAKDAIKDKQTKLVKPAPGIINALRHRLAGNNGKV